MERIYSLTNQPDEVERPTRRCGYAIVREEEGVDGKPEFIAFLFDMEGKEVDRAHAYSSEATAIRYTKRRAGANVAKFVTQAEDYNGAKVIAGALFDADEGKFIVTISSRDENFVDSPTTTITELFADYEEAWQFYERIDLRKYGKLESSKHIWRRTYEERWGKRQVLIAHAEFRHWAEED